MPRAAAREGPVPGPGQASHHAGAHATSRPSGASPRGADCARTTPSSRSPSPSSLPVVLWGVDRPERAGRAPSTAARTVVVDALGWCYLLVATALLIAVVVLAVSPLRPDPPGRATTSGRSTRTRRLVRHAVQRRHGHRPGLLGRGRAGRALHRAADRRAPAPTTPPATSLRYTFFHWGLHPWAIYSVLALALAYARFRRGAPGTVSGALRPLLGPPGVDGPLGTRGRRRRRRRHRLRRRDLARSRRRAGQRRPRRGERRRRPGQRRGPGRRHRRRDRAVPGVRAVRAAARHQVALARPTSGSPALLLLLVLVTGSTACCWAPSPPRSAATCRAAAR